MRILPPMLPAEKENRADMVQILAPVIIPAATKMLDVGRSLTSQLPKELSRRHTLNVLRIAAGLISQATLHYRAIFIAAEHNLDEPASMIARSLLEDLLAERFVLMRPRRVPSLKTKLLGLAIPKGKTVADFRADLYGMYHIYRFTQNWKQAAELKGITVATAERNQRMEQVAKEIEHRVGRRWARVMRKTKSYSGLTVAELAERYGLKTLHRAVYSDLSLSSHSNKASSYLRYEDDTFLIRMHGNLRATLNCIQLGTALYGQFIEDIAQEFHESVQPIVMPLMLAINSACDQAQEQNCPMPAR